jgi:hypothetical protein
MLVISAYNKHTANNGDGFIGYISGACGQPGQPTCPNEGPGLVHDFGSILNFIEWAFGTGGNFLSLPGYPPSSGISPGYEFADWLAPDGPNAGCSSCTYGLSDFFNFSHKSSFVQITSYAYFPTTFENWGVNDGNVPTDPDADAYESQQ